MKDLCDCQLPTCRHRRIKNSAFRLCVATAFLSAIGSLGYTLPLCAATPAAGTTITNQATGSFVDELDSSNTETPVQSNIVTVTVAEVAGITVTASNIPNAAPGGIANFEFIITNVGNDPTQFFIPNAPSAITGGTAGPIKVIGYDPDGSGATPATDLTANNITVTGSGATTGTLLGAIAAANQGVIPAGGSIIVQIPVNISASVGQSVSVTLGNTASQISNSNTPFIIGANGSVTGGNGQDLYTEDNADTVDGETAGSPVNGDATNQRQEASITNSVTVIAVHVSVQGKIFSDADANVAINGTDTGTNGGISNLTIYAVNNTGIVVDKATVSSANGTLGEYTLNSVPVNSNITLRISKDSTIPIDSMAPTTPSLPTGWFHTGENVNGMIDPVIATLGDIALTTTTTNLTQYNFGIRQSYVLPDPVVPSTCAANFTTRLNTGVTSAGAVLNVNDQDLNWTAEWLAGPTSGTGTPFAIPRPVGVMPAVVTGQLAGTWVAEPTGVRWISYPFRLSSNGNGNHQNADLDGSANETTGSGANTTDTVRIKYTAKIALPSNANTTPANISVSLPVGVSVDNQFVSLKVNGVENLTPSPIQDPYVQDFTSIKSINIQNGWKSGLNTIEIITDSGPPLTGFFLAVQATTTQLCPNVLLVKRITGVNGITTTANGQDLATYHQEEANPYDDNLLEPSLAPTTSFPALDTDKWPNTTGKTSSTFLVGGTDGGTIRPNDTIDYTIYFLSTGVDTAKNVTFCDRVPSNVTFVPGAFNTGIPAGNGGLVGGDRGIAVNLGGTLKAYTNANDDDFARYYPPGIEPSANCGGSNTNGAVVVNLGNIPHATTPGTTGSYGFVRFRGRVR